MYDKLTSRFPHILFESCSSGGARFDPGMLYYAPQTWTSDDTDAVERLKIQYGTSFVYPLSTIGAHVSAVPNHQVGRNTSLHIRGSVAYFGAFGYELDVTKMTDEEKEIVKGQVKFYKNYRELIQKGTFYRLISPFEGDQNETAWIVVSKDRMSAIVGYYQVLAKPLPKLKKLPLVGLDPNALYKVEGTSTTHYGDELMHFGLLLEEDQPFTDSFGVVQKGDFTSQLFVLKGDFTSQLFVLKATKLEDE